MTESDLYKTYLSKAMALAASKEICSSDIQKKLDAWGATTMQSEKIIEQLKSDRFIDENRYAAAFTKDKFRYNKWGKIKIASHLRMKNIPEQIITTALELIDREGYIASIKSILLSHRKHVRAKNNFDLKAKMLRFGLSKGFESSILYDLIGEFGMDEDVEA